MPCLSALPDDVMSDIFLQLDVFTAARLCQVNAFVREAVIQCYVDSFEEHRLWEALEPQTGTRQDWYLWLEAEPVHICAQFTAQVEEAVTRRVEMSLLTRSIRYGSFVCAWCHESTYEDALWYFSKQILPMRCEGLGWSSYFFEAFTLPWTERRWADITPLPDMERSFIVALSCDMGSCFTCQVLDQSSPPLSPSGQF